ncbi:unnamed protein product [Symbiodinium sp. KB8]|nr:unnamed protein product [Symbiodinium sp. KB8]
MAPCFCPWAANEAPTECGICRSYVLRSENACDYDCPYLQATSVASMELNDAVLRTRRALEALAERWPAQGPMTQAIKEILQDEEGLSEAGARKSAWPLSYLEQPFNVTGSSEVLQKFAEMLELLTVVQREISRMAYRPRILSVSWDGFTCIVSLTPSFRKVRKGSSDTDCECNMNRPHVAKEWPENATARISSGERLGRLVRDQLRAKKGEYTGEIRRYDIWCDEIKALKVKRRNSDASSPFIREELYAAWAGSGPAEKGVVIDAYHKGNLMRFINCSCKPNCSFKSATRRYAPKESLTNALRAIEVGEQLSVDYGWYHDPATLEDIRKEAVAVYSSDLPQLQALQLPEPVIGDDASEAVQLVAEALKEARGRPGLRRRPHNFLAGMLDSEALARFLESGKRFSEAATYRAIPDPVWLLYEVLGAERPSQYRTRKRSSDAMQPACPGNGGFLRLLHGEARRLLSSAAKTSRGPGGCEKCRRLLGVGRSASREKLRRAFLAAAWKHHPDGLGEGDFVELRRCYELLLENCDDSESGQDELPCSGTQEQDEPVQSKQASRRRPLQSGSARWASARAPGLAAKIAAPERLEVRVELALTASPLPPFLWATAATAGRGPWRERPGLAFCGFYYRTIDYNAAPAFAHTQFRFYLFWSRFFSDWKIAGALSEKGACTAFFDGRRDDPPWGCAANGDPKPQQWAVWDADADSFAKQAVLVRPIQRCRP